MLIDEGKRKKIIQAHCQRLNAGDLDGLLALYAADPAFEDPVGAGRRSGREALRAHLALGIEANTKEVPGDAIASQDGVHALMPITAVMDYLPKGREYAARGWLTAPDEPVGKHLKCEYVLMLRIGAGDLIEELKAYWGRDELEVTD
ncbi:nuclear transport factor 2 family protein [Actinomadura roseirufa]|uniref:nuclear transport factor 2 family protein n=1 Tax=Actinomadura roseirufa TaxID=2094049 RepID=UPI001A955D22|nr:nuclear transport factor 2 family protein [Actinomadura roseirufa]